MFLQEKRYLDNGAISFPLTYFKNMVYFSPVAKVPETIHSGFQRRFCMFRALLSSRLIQVGLVFFVVVVSGSLLYSWQIRRTTVAEFTRTDIVPPKTRFEQDIVDTSTVDFEQSETPLEVDDSQMSDDTGVSPIDEVFEMHEMADSFLPDDFVSEEAPTEDVPVSPFGFGPYPELPLDYPWTPPWTVEIKPDTVSSTDHLSHELMHRVLIELWTQGDKNIIGGSVDKQTLMVYPTYPKTAYVTYGYVDLPDGTVRRYIKSMEGGDDLPHLSPEMAFRGQVPLGVNVINKEGAGINPYSFLQLGEKR